MPTKHCAEPPEQLYCHQQICIPPTFPYLLKQYAKAAIRSQPTDLLKWSTAYFRCLALNVPPPVKPRLEYPIPRDYIGVTPGWLKALNYQLQNCKTVNFRILWDRWIGSCLEHNVLLQILCLGGFNNPDKIPWNKFIGLCAGFLNDSLTQTMIMYCEIMTEEPEGGSAMIPLESFLEVYKFLAMIDASQPQVLPNLYFTDDYLALVPKEKKKKKKRRKAHVLSSSTTSSVTVEEIVEEQEPESSVKAESSIVSCPDIASDEALKEREVEVLDEVDVSFMPGQKESSDHISDEALGSDEDLLKDDVSADKIPEEEAEGLVGEGEGEAEAQTSDVSVATKQDEGEPKEDAGADADRDTLLGDEGSQAEVGESKHSDSDQGDEDVLSGKGVAPDEDKTVAKKAKGEEGGEEEEELGSYDEEASGEDVGYDELDELEKAIRAEYAEMAKEGEEEVGKEEALPEAEEERKIEEVSIPAVPGIGPKVPDELVDAVERYLKRMAAEEHGMTMPRHIRHYNCPPLEVLDYQE